MFSNINLPTPLYDFLKMLLYKLFELWDSKTFENHFKDIQKFYQERRDIMLAAVKKHLTGMLYNNFNIL